MALVARILDSFTGRFLEVAQRVGEPIKPKENGSFVGTCLCPECGKILEVRDVNGHEYGSKIGTQ